MKTITVEYMLNTDNWSDDKFYNEPIDEFVITEDMIRGLILQNTKIEKGDYIHEISNIKPTQYVKL